MNLFWEGVGKWRGRGGDGDGRGNGLCFGWVVFWMLRGSRCVFVAGNLLAMCPGLGIARRWVSFLCYDRKPFVFLYIVRWV